MKNTLLSPKRFSIRFTISCIFLIVTGLTALLALSLKFHFTQAMSEELLLSKIANASSKISAYIQNLDIDASRSIKILKDVSITNTEKFSQQETRNLLIQVLKENPLFFSIYYAKANEDFYQVINLEASSTVRKELSASEHDRWATINISGEGPQRHRNVKYFDERLNLTHKNSIRSNTLPTQRPWYKAATSNQVYKTEPYLFKQLNVTGQTYAIRTSDSVLGIDVVLSSINSQLTSATFELTNEQGVESFIYNAAGELHASNMIENQQFKIPVSKALKLSARQQRLIANTPTLIISNQNNWPPLDYSIAGQPDGYAIDLLKLISELTGLRFKFVNGFRLDELQTQFKNGKIDLLHSVSAMHSPANIVSCTMYQQKLAIAVNNDYLKYSNASDLNDKTLALISGQGFGKHLTEQGIRATFKHYSNLNLAIEALKAGSVDAIVNTEAALRYINFTNLGNSNISINLLPKLPPVNLYIYLPSKHTELMEVINKALSNISVAQKNALHEKWLTKDAYMQRSHIVPYHQLTTFAQNPQRQRVMIKQQVADANKYFFVAPLQTQGWREEYFAIVVPEHIITDAAFEQAFSSSVITAAILLLLIPLSWLFGSPIVRAITSLKAETNKVKHRQFDEIHPVNTRIKEIWQLSNSVQDMAGKIQKYQQDQNDFIEAFIRLTAQAIDDKSPYTAGHCNRVPELGLMLAKVAEETRTGQFKDFCFANDNERREFRIAAWLHDCGKITTPEFIVDKGTKLEANYNRIHEIRMRFEVLWRDAEIDYLKSLLQKPESEAVAVTKLQQRQTQLKDDFEFVANSNVGGEFMSEDKIQRIKTISQQTWMRHFSDRLGLSPLDELSRPSTEQTLPVTEPLLADRPEHIIHRDREMTFDPKFNIKMDVPEHLYNLGEIHNLSISRGTLTAEDRFKINEHMISGIKILEALPFPKELSRVPRYATSHHETLKGTGYPRKLTAEQLSVPERILVIADIFEALTAADRPYKKAKSLSVAVEIMFKMALDEHVDMELFLLFLESGTYHEYAQKFLPPSQIDNVDINKYLERIAE
ncbi:HD domain-containing phosphohydrolase [Aliamphritea ceti]|uniref:HD domain-containing phosphohydrolase n=1 Tax=Aliamphritea ceti TaxID=1524258 RepID=UPI0021C4C637|nr:HD domain-containing phosphohydrolase [Aliamphritea ceti]